MPNKRISDLDEKQKLSSQNIANFFPSGPNPPAGVAANPEEFMLLAVQESHNEKISYSNIKKSLIDASVSTHTSQVIAGKKTFSGGCTFEKDITEDGDMAIKNLTIKGSNTIELPSIVNLNKPVGGASEAQSFSLKIPSGVLEIQGLFKKTFNSIPVVSCNLSHDSGGQPIPTSITNITNKSLTLKFASATPDDGYSANINIFPSNIEAFNHKDSQRFTFDLPEGLTDQTITFPFEYQSIPVVSVTIECNSQSFSHSIKDVTTSNFKLILNSPSVAGTKAHILTSEIGTKNGI